jgi:ABC-type bacteriocin/lantibiotic exporter with double-glycine peptidase domain
MALKDVPVYSQRTLSLCWEACAKIMWHWRYKSLSGYEKKAGDYLKINSGISHAEMDRFYTTLGMRSLKKPAGKNLRHALQWTPVIFTLTDKVSGHALVAVGYNNNKFEVINPCAIETISFEEGADSCKGGSVPLEKIYVERLLGSYIWYW